MSTSDNDANAIAAQCADLIRRRTTIGNRLLRFNDYLSDVNIGDNIVQLKLRFDKTEVLWDSYDEIHSKIKSLAYLKEVDLLLDRKKIVLEFVFFHYGQGQVYS